MLKKNIGFTISAILVLAISLLVFYVSNFIFIIIGNHAALDLVIFAGFPMYLITASVVTFFISSYRYQIKNQKDSYFVRHYGRLYTVFGFIGLLFSLFVGVVVYKSFFKDYIFFGYPFFTALLNAGICAFGVYLWIKSQKKINKGEQRTFKPDWKYNLKTLGLTLLLLFALNRLGAFLLIPCYYSDIDGAWTLPYLFELLVPATCMVAYCVKDNKKDSKIPLISGIICLSYSIISLIYMIVVSVGRYPLTLNSLSVIQQLERLIKIPSAFILLYAVSILIPLISIILHLIKSKKENH